MTFNHLYYHLLSKPIYSDRRTDSFSHAAVGFFFARLPANGMTIPAAYDYFPRCSLSEVLFTSTDTAIFSQGIVYIRSTIARMKPLQIQCLQSRLDLPLKHSPTVKSDEQSKLSGEIAIFRPEFPRYH